ncbi:MAG: filamentous hemagglutinin N-terminal domain-containing protein [Phycisphaeraceae bacterium]|nr:filamentous hemagglutinin N-terminal domain-containing protein [Phycisphaeraceae bacterium]
MKKFILIFSAAALLSVAAYAEPRGGNVVAGDASWQDLGRKFIVNQTTDRAIINWQSFGIDADQVVRFGAASARSAILNRVTGGDLSRLDGRLVGNGQVFLINPAGVIVGPGGRIDVAGFTASTLDVNNNRFMAGGDLLFRGDSSAAIINQGSINATSGGGGVILIAQRVDNLGNITAPNGTVGMAAGSAVLLMQDGDDRLAVRLGIDDASLNNAGLIEAAAAELKAAGGNVYALAINNGGVIRATGVTHRDGRVILDASTGATQHSGTIEAAGGQVRVLGDQVTLTSGSSIDVSSTSSGGGVGTILIGGDYHGDNPLIHNARNTLVDFGATIHADGGDGKVVVWADDATRFGGHISARGGDIVKDGGFVEVSGKQTLTFRGSVDVTAPTSGGTPGSLLLDPENITIASGVGVSPPSGDWSTRDVANNITIYEDDLEAFVGVLYVSADNNLTIQNLADDELTLQATEASFMANNEVGLTSQGGVVMNDLADTIRMTAPGARITFQGGQLSGVGTRSASIDIGNVVTNGGDVRLLVKRASAALPIYCQDITTSGGDFIVDRIDLANSNNVNFTSEGLISTGGGDVAVSLVGNINITAGISLGAGTLSFSGTNTNLSSAITATGDVTISSVLNFSAGSSISTDGSITFTSTANMNAGGSLTLSATDFNFQNTFTGNAGSLTLRPNTVAGNMTINAATFANLSGFSSVTLGRADGTGTATLTGAIAISDPFALIMGGAGGTINQTGSITGSDDASITFTAGGFINIGDTIDVPAGLTFTAPSININSAIDAGVGSVTFTVGSLAFTDDLAGDGALTIQPYNVAADITINANTFLNISGFSSYTIGRADGTGTATISGALAIADPLTVRMGGAGGTINQTGTVTGSDDAAITYTAGASISISDSLDVPAGVTLTAPTSVSISGDIDGGAGDVSITTNSIALTGSLAGAGSLSLIPSTASTTIGLGDGAAGSFNLTSTEIANLTDGFSAITIGHASGSGDIDIRNAAFNDPLTIRTPTSDGDVTINGALSTTGDVNITTGDTLTIAAAGSISSGGGDVTLNADGAGTGSGAIIARGPIITSGGDISFLDNTYLAADLDTSNGSGAGGDIDFNAQVLLYSGAGITIDTTGGSGGSDGDVTFAGLLDSANDYTLVNDTTRTWLAALAHADFGDGDDDGDTYLATVTSALENAIVVSTANGSSVWLGGSDTDTEGEWRWVTGPEGLEEGGAGRQFWQGAAAGSAVGGAYENWNGGEPNNSGNEDALQGGFTAQGYWNDLPTNSSALYYIKETNAAATALTINGGNVNFNAAVGSNKALASLDVNASGNLTTAAAVTVEGAFAHDGAGSASLGGDITSTSGDGSITLNRAATLTTAIELSAASITTTAAITAAAHNLTLTTDSLALGASVSGSADLTIQPLSAATTIALGSASTGTLKLNDAELARLTDGFNHMYIGKSDAGNIEAGAWTTDNPLELITAGNVAINGALSVTTNGLTIDSDGTVTQSAAISTDALLLLGAGTFTLTNTSNAVDRIAADLTGGSLSFVNGTDLSVGSVYGTDGVTNTAGSVTIVTTGDLTLDEAVTASGGVVLSTTGSFINNVGAAAIDPGAGRFLLYSVKPADNTLNGLASDGHLYNRAYAANPPASITQLGDLLIYSYQPTLTFTADDKSKTYGDANPALTYAVSGLVNGDVIGDAVTGAPALSTVAAGSDAGTHAITIAAGTLASDMGYALAFVNGELTINKAALTITADDAVRLYGAANPAFTATYTGLVNGDASTVVTGLTITTAATAGSDVGTYNIVPAAATATNYDITFVNGTLTINKAALTITADDFSRAYGAANPTFTASYSGLVAGDDESAVNGLTLTTLATPASARGTYAITAAGATATNYDITLVNGTLTVTRAPLTITVADKTRVYGSANPAFTAGYSGLVNGDTAAVVTGLTLASSATAASDVGNYAITGSGATANNYIISYVNGSLNVTKAPLTITAHDASRALGAVNPAFTAGYSGLMAWDDASVVAGLKFNTVGTSAAPGTYAITPFGGTSQNYSLTYVNGTLTVTSSLDPGIFYDARNVMQRHKGRFADDVVERFGANTGTGSTTLALHRPADGPERGDELGGYTILVSLEKYQVLSDRRGGDVLFDPDALNDMGFVAVDTSFDPR